MSADAVVHDTTAYHPFSFGPSACAGKSLALLEMRMFVCAVLRKFNLRVADAKEAAAWEGKAEDVFVVRRATLGVILEGR